MAQGRARGRFSWVGVKRFLAGMFLLFVLALLTWAFSQPPRNNPFEGLDWLTWLRARNEDAGYFQMPFVPAGATWRFVPRNLWNESKTCCGINVGDEHVLTFFDEKGAVHTVSQIHHSPHGQLFVLSVDGALYALVSPTNWQWRKVALPALYAEDDRKRFDYGHPTLTNTTSKTVNSLAVSPDSRSIAFAGDDPILRSTVAHQATQQWQADGHSDAIVSIDYNADGSRLVTASRDGTARVWSAEQRRNTTADVWDSLSAARSLVLRGHSGPVNSARFSPDSKRIVTASADGTARLWNSDTGVSLRSFVGHTAPINTAEFSKDGKQIITASDDGSIGIWDSARPGRLPGIVVGIPVMGASESPDGQTIAAITNEDLVLWSRPNGFFAPSWKRPCKGAFKVAFSPGGERLLCAGALGIRVFALDGNPVAEYPQGSATALTRSVAYAPNGRELIIGSSDGSISYLQTEWGPQPHISTITSSTTGMIWLGGTDGYLAFSPNGKDWHRLPLDPSVGSSSGAEDVYNREILSIAATGANDALILMSGNILRKIEGAALSPPSISGTTPAQYAALTPPLIKVETAGSHPLATIYFRSAEEGWAAGADGIILHTLDAAKTWTQQFALPDLRLHDLIIEESGVGWAVGFTKAGGMVAVAANRATDDGGTWAPLPFHLGRWFYLIGLPLLVLALFCNVRAWRRPIDSFAGQSIEEIAISDDPLRWTDPESLALRPLARSLSRFLRNIKTRPPLTIAVTGRWGSGKSSLMQLLMSDIQYYDGRAVWFNAWHHRDEDDLLAALFSAIRRKVPPGWWSWPGLAFRVRLFGLRSRDQARHLGYIVLFLAIAITTLHVGVGHLPYRVDEILASVKVTYPALNMDTWDPLVRLSLLGSGASLTALLVTWLSGKFVALPANPAKLAAALARHASLSDFSAKLAFRSRFGEQFGEVCNALMTSTSPGLVIFIDDLDRCQPDDVLKVLEAVNYLTSAGPCTIVLGMDRRQVEHSVGLGFAKLVEGLPYEELEMRPGEDLQFAKQRAFAKLYLEKLINIEVLVPALNDSNTEVLLTQGVAKSAADTTDGPRWLREWKRDIRSAVQIARVGLIAFAAGILLIWVVDHFPVAPPAARKDAATPASASAATPPAAGADAVSSAASSNPSFMPAQYTTKPVPLSLDLPASTQWTWWAPAILFLGIAALFGLRTSSRVAKRIVRDSPEFAQALRCVKPLFTTINATPRIIKRYQNRMRYLAARLRPDFHEPDAIDTVLHWLGMRFGRSVVPQEWFTSAPAPSIRESSLILLGAIELFATEAFADAATLAADLKRGAPGEQASAQLAVAWGLVMACFEQHHLAVPVHAEIERFAAIVFSKS